MPLTALKPKRISRLLGLAVNENLDSLIFGGRTLIPILLQSLIIVLILDVFPDFNVKAADWNSVG
jgi:hypothetical protein